MSPAKAGHYRPSKPRHGVRFHSPFTRRSLGFGGGDLPAVARITPSLLLAADPIPAVVVPAVELWQVPEYGTPLTPMRDG